MLRELFLVAAGALAFDLAAIAVLDQRALAGDDPASLTAPATAASDSASFVAAGAASMIVLPGTASASNAAAAAEDAAQQALLRRASEEAGAAAEIRRKAEDLSRRFVSEHGDVSATPGSAPDASPAMASIEPVRAVPAAAIASTVARGGEAIVTTADPLDVARRQAAEAEARAAAERTARLAAEANAGAAIEQAAKALARAREEAEAATRRAAAAEARALKATQNAQRQISKAAAATVSVDKQRAATRVHSAAVKMEPAPPAVAIVKPGALTSVPKSALGAMPPANATLQPGKEPPSKWSPPSPPVLSGLVPSFAQ